MNKGDYLTTLLRSPQTVLTRRDISLLWREEDSNKLSVRLNYYVEKGELIRLRQGIYAKSPDYNPLELATRIFTPSYLSFETALSHHGLIFQYHESITVATYLTRTITVKGITYHYRSLKKPLLINNQGIDQDNSVSMAGKERALLDTLYVNHHYYFDNLRSIDWDTISSLLPLYHNQRILKIVSKLREENTK